jgi:capsular exopolysaccharide synthesis family protein
MKEKREIVPQAISESVEIERPFEPQIVPSSGRYPGYRENYAQEGFQILDYWRAIRKRLWLVIGIAVLVTTWTAILMARKPNVYLSKSVVQVDLEQTNPDLVTSESKRPLANPDPAYFNTQLQLLASESLLRRVVKDKNLDSDKDFQQARNDASVSAWRSMLKSLGLASDDRREDKGDLQRPAAGNAESTAANEDIAEAVRLSPYVELLRRDITIEPVRESRATVKDTRLIEISYRNTNPTLAAFVANGIAETFVEANQEKRSGTSRKTNDFLQQRIADLQTEIKSDEQKLVELKQKEGILKTEGDQTIVLDRLSGLNKQLLEAENQRKNAEANYLTVSNSPDRLRALAEEQMARYTTEQENNIRAFQTDIVKRIADLRQKRSLLLQEYKETAPEIKEIDAQIQSNEESIDRTVKKFKGDLEEYRARTTKDLLENLKTKYLQAKDQEDKIRADFNKQYDEAQGQNQGAVLLKLLEQNIDTNKGFLENLIKQQSGNDIAARGSDNNISIAEIAIPSDTPVAPRRITTVCAALLLSTLFGMGLALVLEYLDDTIRSTEEIESYLQLPALAAIPAIDSIPKRRLLLVGAQEDDGTGERSELLINADSRSSLGEAYRQLRTLILLSTAGHPPKTLLVTSSLPAEGKTTTATNTAISLAQTGAKVLIIDADMRRPRLHSVFGIENSGGLSSVLSSDLDDDEILAFVRQDERTNLNILTSGPIPPNPAELIGSEQMAKLLRTLQAHYTHVVVDSPPIASFTDGVLIASMVDGVVLVVNAGETSRQVVRRSRQLLQDIGARILGVVLNNVNLRSQDYYYDYQSYYHRNNYNTEKE